ncbi:MAG: GTPase ObgE, partial [Leptolyngbyaceae cyanobacterium CAN_BIN12]|nr:GTPase ObgE [Leptolyngbyaceae cyanobacterium CAN_BIN12]
PQIVALSKLDAVDEAVDIDAIAAQLHQLSHAPIFKISSATLQGLDAVLNQVWQQLDQMTSVKG